MRTIPAALQAHMDTMQTTICTLIKITQANGTIFGITSLDQDVTYDDGTGSLVYSSATGMSPTAFETDSTLSVGNSEITSLFSSALTQGKIVAGEMDYAEFVVHKVNWADLTMGHYSPYSGTTGIVKSADALSATIELRTLTQQLKQNFIDLYSIPCRASFGSQTGEELFPCMFDATSLWQATEVATVGSETDRIFTAADTPAATGPNGALPFDSALIEFTSGANDGLTVETETVDGVNITLRFQANYPIEVGDTFNIRPDCTKRYLEDCIAQYANGDYFRGEPYIPLTEESRGQIPGANVRGLGAPPVTDTTSDPPIVPDPPANEVDITGAVSWLSFFGSEFLESAYENDYHVIPVDGVAIYFDIPLGITDPWRVLISTIDTNAIPTRRFGAINYTVLDFTTAPTHIWGTGGGLNIGINYTDSIDIVGTPGNRYILNLKNETPSPTNWIRVQVNAIINPS